MASPLYSVPEPDLTADESVACMGATDGTECLQACRPGAASSLWSLQKSAMLICLAPSNAILLCGAAATARQTPSVTTFSPTLLHSSSGRLWATESALDSAGQRGFLVCPSPCHAVIAENRYLHHRVSMLLCGWCRHQQRQQSGEVSTKDILLSFEECAYSSELV